jgi:tRNA C32,U32 (ribose-2'-O)-methylase TrmJ
LYDVDLNTPLALIMGSEEDGISPQLLKDADRLAKIPMRGKISSLNVSVAAGISIYEALRQKRLQIIVAVRFAFQIVYKPAKQFFFIFFAHNKHIIERAYQIAIKALGYN